MADPTQVITQQNAVSSYAAPYVEKMLGQAQALTDVNQNPYQAYPGQRTAGFTGLQNQAFQGASDLQTPGGFGTGAALTQAGGLGALQTAGQAGMYGRQGQMAGLQGMMAGMGYGQQATNPYAVQSYMNPYLQASLAPQLELMNRQYGQQAAQNAGQATQAGAFGGSRFGLQQAQNQLNQNLATQNLIGGAYNQAYNTAQQNMQAAAQLGMQGAGYGIQGAQAGLQGIGAQQAGYGAAANAGTAAANIANQQLAAQQNILNQQQSLGAVQQQQQQNILNQQYQDFLNQKQYPYQQLSFMQNILSGLPLTSTTQNVYSNPNLMSQVAGLGTAAAGAYGLYNKAAGSKKGGMIKEKKAAGLADLALSKMA